jgi:hypothetical protein
MFVLMAALGFTQMGASGGCPPKTISVHTAVKGVVPGLDFSDEIWHGDAMVGSSDLVEVNETGGVDTFYYNGVTHYSVECGGSELYGIRHFVHTAGQGSATYVGPGAVLADDHSNLTEWSCAQGQGSLDPNGVRWVSVDANCHVTPVCKVQWVGNGGPNPTADPVQTITELGLYIPNPGEGWMPWSDGDFGLGGVDFDCGSYPGKCFGAANVRGSGSFYGCFHASSWEETMPLAGVEVRVTSFATDYAHAVTYVTDEDGCVTVSTDPYLVVLPQS